MNRKLTAAVIATAAALALTGCTINIGGNDSDDDNGMMGNGGMLNNQSSGAYSGADIMFAGHTHGGQVCIPGFGAMTTNCDLPVKHAKGLSSWKFGGRHSVLNVVAGLGHSIYAPVRFACRPEVRLLTLLPRA